MWSLWGPVAGYFAMKLSTFAFSFSQDRIKLAVSIFYPTDFSTMLLQISLVKYAFGTLHRKNTS